MAKGVASKKAGVLAYLAWIFIAIWFVIYWFELLKTITNNLSATNTTVVYFIPVIISLIFGISSRKLEGKSVSNLFSILISSILMLFALFSIFVINVVIN